MEATMMEATMSSQPTPNGNGGAASSRIQPATLLRELDALWAEFGKKSDDPANGGVVRACSLTWISIVEGGDQEVQEADEVLASVMRVHPSRAILVLLRKDEGRALKASVSAQCWRPFGSKQQVCIERILIEASRSSACDLPAVIRALLVADLPVVLFCRDPRLLSVAGIQETSQMADRVVVDISFRTGCCAHLWPDLPGMGRFVSDLAWDRIIGFRRAIASYFATPARRELLSSLQELHIHTDAKRPTPEAAYLLSWILGSLGFERASDAKHPESRALPRWSKGDLTVQAGFVAAPQNSSAVTAVEFRSQKQSVRFTPGDHIDGAGLEVVPMGDLPSDTELLSDEMVVEYRKRSFEQFLPTTIQLFEESPYFADE
jgi:hypothetical protein